MEPLRVVIQSLKEAAKGTPLLENSPPIENYTRCDLTVGILEGGMQSGKTSLMILLQDGDKVYYAEMSANHFEALGHAVRGAQERFGDNLK